MRTYIISFIIQEVTVKMAVDISRWSDPLSRESQTCSANDLDITQGAHGEQLVEAVRCKPEGRRFDCR